ncbi:hypothetical protein HPB47_022879 [Ixodes persulcatus]|uniref:Uncharacterized protein n=1 Tax=Ixodes persulcatus TaxID=34615 RepID=A0AC60Q8J4_IXOPE|nr:hypothetical protein HPB47_022879 [Ixodes persulcatus]
MNQFGVARRGAATEESSKLEAGVGATGVADAHLPDGSAFMHLTKPEEERRWIRIFLFVTLFRDPKGPRIKPFKCVTCFKRFASAESLRVHCYYMHRVVKLHCCLGCRRSFKKRYDLRKHWERSPLCQAFGDEDCPPQF